MVRAFSQANRLADAQGEEAVTREKGGGRDHAENVMSYIPTMAGSLLSTLNSA